MNNFEKVPNEILSNLFTYLDKESMLIATGVCKRWWIVIHDLSWKRVSKLAEGDRSLKEDFAMFGWIEDEHELGRCRCIGLHLGYYPFKNASWTLQRIENTFSNVDVEVCDEFFALMKNSKVICARTYKANNEYERRVTNLTLYELDLEETSPTWKVVYDLKYDGVSYVEVLTHIECREKTMVLWENRIPYGWEESEERISLWNTETWSRVCDLPLEETVDEILKAINGVCGKRFKILEEFEFENFLVSSDILVVLVYLHDWDDMIDMSAIAAIALFWKFDASNPVAPLFFTHILLEIQEEQNRELHLNEKYFCQVVEHEHLEVFAIEDINNNATNKSWIVKLEDDLIKSTLLERGDSGRFAVINDTGEERQLKLINIESGDCFFSLKLNTISQLVTDSEWIAFNSLGPKIEFHLGKLIFLLPLRKRDDPLKCRYQVGVIDETAKNQIVKGAALSYDLIDGEEKKRMKRKRMMRAYPSIGSGFIVKNSPNYISCWKI